MDAVLLDTNVFSYLLKKGDARAELYKSHVLNKTIALSFITIGELYYGMIKARWGSRKVAEMEERIKTAIIVPYDQELCRVFGRTKVNLDTMGKSIETNDLWIAACAIRHSIPLISHNRKHFDGIPALNLISEAPPRTPRPTNRELFDDTPSS